MLSAAKAALSRETSGGSHGNRPPDALATDGDRKALLPRRTSARASQEIDAMVHDTVLAAAEEGAADATAPAEARQSVDVNSDAEAGFTPVAPEGYGLFSGHGVYGVYGGGGHGGHGVGGGLGRGGAYSEAARQQAWREEFKNVWKMSC